MDRLVTERVSRAEAEQRKGRAGRLGAGTCLRFWREEEALKQETEPEILRSDLSALVLECAVWGAKEPEALKWLDPPPSGAWEKARTLLVELGALADDGTATQAGKELLGLGLTPRLGKLVRAGQESGRTGLAAACAALLEERDELSLRGEPDFRLRLEALRTGVGAVSWRKAVGREKARILVLLGEAGREVPWSARDENEAGKVLAAGFPDRLARRQLDGTFDFVQGRKARLPRGITGELADSAWLVAPLTDAGEDIGTIRLAVPISEKDALLTVASFVTEEEEVEWKGLTPKLVSLRRAGKLEIGRSRENPKGSAAESFYDRLGKEGLEILPWNERTKRFLAKLRAYSRSTEDGESEFSDESLLKTAKEWLFPYLDERSLRGSGRPILTEDAFFHALEGLAVPFRRDLEREAPESLELPTGSKRRIDYSGEKPVLEGKIQEFFGLAATPKIRGRPLVLRLLSPAGRPLQITEDLESFWKNTYPEVRKELRGRYPKHYWPEDPLQAEPTRGPKPKRPLAP